MKERTKKPCGFSIQTPTDETPTDLVGNDTAQWDEHDALANGHVQFQQFRTDSANPNTRYSDAHTNAYAK